MRNFDRADWQSDDYIDANYEPEEVRQSLRPVDPAFHELCERLRREAGGVKPDTWLNELGYTLHLPCGGVVHHPRQSEYGGTVVRCVCAKLPTTLEVVA